MAPPRKSALVGLLSLLIAACDSTGTGPAPEAPPSAPASAQGAEVAVPLTKRSAEGDVTVEATWAGPGSGATFDVKLDTHSVDLDGLDLADAVLRNDRDETLTARPWAAPSGGHHRAGVLTFDGDATGLFADAEWIELVISGVGSGPERVLRWEIGG